MNVKHYYGLASLEQLTMSPARLQKTLLYFLGFDTTSKITELLPHMNCNTRHDAQKRQNQILSVPTG